MFPFTPNITNWTASTGSGGVGPTGPTGPAATPGPMASSRINTPISSLPQNLDPSDPNPSYIQFELSSGLYDYDNPEGNYTLTTPIAITINETGYYNVGVSFNIVNNNDPGNAVFQIHNLTSGAIGTVPPICSLDISLKPIIFPAEFSYVGTGSSDANCYLEAGSILQVAYVVDINCEVTPTSCIYITKLDGAVGPTGPAGPSSFQNDGFSVLLTGGDFDVTSQDTLVPFNSANPTFGGFNPSSIYNTSTYTATIINTGIYLLTTSVDYTHNFNTASETAVVNIKRGGLSGNSLAASSLFYASLSNDIETIVCTKIVALNAGDNISVWLSVPVTSDQTISSNSHFSCQRLA